MRTATKATTSCRRVRPRALQGLALWVALVAAAPVRAADDPERLVQEAMARNPSLMALRARIGELGELASVAGTWQDPVIGIEYSNAPVDSLSLNDHAMSAVQVQAAQTIPPRHWSRLRTEVAESRTATGEFALAEAQARLGRDVLVLFWRLTLSRMLEEVTREHVARTEDLLGAVRARYETGAAGQNQLLRLQVLRDRLRDDLRDFTRTEREFASALARALSRPAESLFETPAQPSPRSVAGTAADWTPLARSERPELKRLEQSVRTSEASAELAGVDGSPNVTVWMKYRLRSIDTRDDDGTDQVALGLSVPIPWGSAQRSRAERAAHLQAARGARARLTAERDRIGAELVAIHARWTRAYEQAIAYRDHLTPTARLALETSFSDYSVGRSSFSTLYEAEVDLLELERTLRTATVETYIQAAAAQAVIGAPPQGPQP